MNKTLVGCTISAKVGPEYGQHKSLQLIIIGTATMPVQMKMGNPLDMRNTHTQIMIREYFVCHLVKYDTIDHDIEADLFGPLVTTANSPLFILPENISNIYLWANQI